MTLHTPPPVPQRPEMRGGGCLVAAGLLLGTVIGIVIGQPSIGLVTGLALGALAAVAFFLYDRSRR